MGLFDRLTGGASDAPLNKQEAFAAIMLAIIAADGDISDEEVEDFGARVNRMQLFNNMSGRQFPDMINKLFRILKKSGVSELINKAVPALTPDLRETVFVVAVDMIFSDGIVENEEKAMIEKLHAQLEISDALVAQTLDVMLIKHRG